MNFDRFKEPNTNDERAACVNCEKPFHYAALDENGLCQECAGLYEEESEQKRLLSGVENQTT